MRPGGPGSWFGRCREERDPSPLPEIKPRSFDRPSLIIVTLLTELYFKHLLCLFCYQKSFLEFCCQLIVINFTVRRDTHRTEVLHFVSQNTTNPCLRILLGVQYVLCLMLKYIGFEQRDFRSVSSLNSSSYYYGSRSLSRA
jgi:hypothetical protein